MSRSLKKNPRHHGYASWILEILMQLRHSTLTIPIGCSSAFCLFNAGVRSDTNHYNCSREGVPAPAEAKGCRCVDGCRPDNPDCKCLQQQNAWNKRFPHLDTKPGFAYDVKGRLVLPETIPIVECGVSNELLNLCRPS